MIVTPALFTARIMAEVEHYSDDPGGIDSDRYALDPIELQLSEVLAGVAYLYEINLPDDDDLLLLRLRRYGRPRSGPARGIVGFTADGIPALMLGRHGSIESDGADLVHLTISPPGRYVEFWTIPDIEYWEARS